MEKNLNNLTIQEVLDMVEDNNPPHVPPLKTRAKIVRVLYQLLGYDLTNDALLALVSEPSAELILATAGAGKTTNVQIKIALEKIIRKINGKPLEGRRVLCLVYNKHNVNQMVKAQEKLSRKIRRQGVNIDSDISAHTMHSYCYKWFNQFNHLTDFSGANMIESSSIISQFNSLAQILLKDSEEEINETLINNLISLYNLLKETMTDYNDCDTLELFETLNLSKDLVVKIFNAYDKGKQRKRVYDYTDMLHELYLLLRDNQRVRDYIQNYYDYIVADEVQDMTKIMMEILRLSKREDVPIVCIGDEDQNIYSFRGATIKTILDFEKTFEDSKVFFLTTNRRCANNIIELANKIISTNTLRYEKSMQGIRDGGSIEYIPYIEHEDQIDDIVNKLKHMDEDTLNQTCICYRNRKSSLLLTCKLEENEIPFYTLSGYKPYEAEVYQHIFSIMRILMYPYDRDEIINIYKILPVLTKKEVYNTLGYSPKTKNFSKPYEKLHFSEYNYGKCMNNPKFQEAMNILVDISNNIKKYPMNTYMNKLWVVFITAFWESKMYFNDNSIDEMLTEKAISFFDSKDTYPIFYEKYNARLDKCRINAHQKNGVCLSTFHSLKGLEFKDVFIIDLNDNIFPNFSKIEESDYSDQLKLELEESETRLFFVAVTRAKDNLIFYYDKKQPSSYIAQLLNNKRGNKCDNLDLDLTFNDDKDDILEFNFDLTEETPKPDINKKPAIQANPKPDSKANFLDTVINRFF